MIDEILGVRQGVSRWLALAVLAVAMASCSGQPAFATDRGLGEMDVVWHMVSQEELNERCATIGVDRCLGFADWSTSPGHIWTLPPTGQSDVATWFAVMHELSHIVLGCYHGAKWNDWIGPEKDGRACAARRELHR